MLFLRWILPFVLLACAPDRENDIKKLRQGAPAPAVEDTPAPNIPLPQNTPSNQNPSDETADAPDADKEESSQPSPEPSLPEMDSQDLKNALTRAGASQGIEYPVMWNHAKSHGLGVSYIDSPRTSDYADIWLAKQMSEILFVLRHKFAVTHVKHLGIYNYRKIAGSEQLSRHAYALAFDIAGFVLKDGTTLTIKTDWSDAVKGPALKQIRDTLCAKFHIVLSPDYNAAHADHLHVDLDPNRRSGEEKAPYWDDLDVALMPLSLVADSLMSGQAIMAEGDEGRPVGTFIQENSCL